MKILFIGGTGRLSSDIAKESVDCGNEVYLITRGSPNRKKFVDKRYNMIYANIKNKEEIKEKIKDLKFDVVIDFLTYNLNELKRTLDIIEEHYKQYIFISTATVYHKMTDDEIISEEKTKLGNELWDYAQNKYICEKYLNEFFSNKKEKFTIVRPYVTYNKTRIPYPLAPSKSTLEYSIIKRIKDNKKVLIFNNGKTRTTLTNTKDFAKGVVGLYLNKDAFNNDFHITSDEEVTWKDVIDYIADYYKLKVEFKNLSVSQISKKYPAYKQILEGDKANKMIFDSSKIKRVVPRFDCKVKLKDGIYETLDFYEKNKEFQLVDYIWYGRMDKICKDRKENSFPSKKSEILYNIGYYTILYYLYYYLKKIKSLVRK